MCAAMTRTRLRRIGKMSCSLRFDGEKFAKILFSPFDSFPRGKLPTKPSWVRKKICHIGQSEAFDSPLLLGAVM